MSNVLGYAILARITDTPNDMALRLAEKDLGGGVVIANATPWATREEAEEFLMEDLPEGMTETIVTVQEVNGL